jgi:hypothetical protein
MPNHQFSAINWAGQTPGTSGTSSINNAAARGDRNANARLGKSLQGGGNTAQPLMPLPGHTASSPDFEQTNNFLAAVHAADPLAMTALTVYGSSAVSRAVATGRLASGRRW